MIVEAKGTVKIVQVCRVGIKNPRTEHGGTSIFKRQADSHQLRKLRRSSDSKHVLLEARGGEVGGGRKTVANSTRCCRERGLVT